MHCVSVCAGIIWLGAESLDVLYPDSLSITFSRKVLFHTADRSETTH
jgi:hypothetical protein